MRGLIAQSVRRPVAVSMLYVAIGLLAVGAWVNLPVELDPTPQFPTLSISTSWGQAAPESMQALVTSPIEAMLVRVPGVRKVNSSSARGVANITVELAEDVNYDLVVFEITDRLALLREQLPANVRPPSVTTQIPRGANNLLSNLRGNEGPFLTYVLQSPRPLNELHAWAEDNLMVPLYGIEGVGSVEVSGGVRPHLQVTLDPQRLELYGLQLNEVRNRIQGLDDMRPIGQVELSGTAYTVRVEQRVDDLEALRRLPLGKVGDSMVLLADVGTVEPAYDRIVSYTRVDGRQQVRLSIDRRSGSDVLTVARAVRARMEGLQASVIPEDIRVELIADMAADLEAELALLGRRLLLILAIVAVLLVLMLRDLRTPLFLFASLGAALALTVVAFYHFEVPVNLLTLTGLALAFGMLVDNAVVVLENIVRQREKGMSRTLAAEVGTSEVVVPVLASTLTTVGVFFPFVLFQGNLRDYYWPLALAVTFALGSSFLVALTLMPAAAGRGWVVRSPRFGRDPGRRYRAALGWAVRHPWLVLGAVGLAGWYSYVLFQEVPAGTWYRFGRGRDALYASLTLPSGSEPGLADQELRPFEDYVLSLPDIERVEFTVSGDRANMRVLFPPELETTAYPLLVKDELIGMATRFAGVRVSVGGFDDNSFYSGGFGYGPSYNSNIQLLGYNYEQLGRFGEEIAATAKRNARVQEAVVTSGARYYSGQGHELVMRLRRDRLEPHGLTVQQVIGQLQTLLRGQTGQQTSLRVGVEDWGVQVKLEGVDRRTLNEVLGSPIRGGSGRGLRIGDLFETVVRSIPGEITRENQRYERWVRWEYRGSSRARSNYLEAIFAGIELPPGYQAKLSDPYRFTAEEQAQIRTVGYVALLIVFMVLASLYESLVQPFIVLMAVPCALIGVFLIFYLTEQPFGPSAYVGVVLLGGIVVNNAIILVDHINLRRRDGLELVEAVLRGAAERVRPILVTSVTTIGGLLPLVLVRSEGSGASDLWSDLALSTIGGLGAATLLTLSVIPVLYVLAERARSGGRGLARRVRRIWDELPV